MRPQWLPSKRRVDSSRQSSLDPIASPPKYIHIQRCPCRSLIGVAVIAILLATSSTARSLPLQQDVAHLRAGDVHATHSSRSLDDGGPIEEVISHQRSILRSGAFTGIPRAATAGPRSARTDQGTTSRRYCTAGECGDIGNAVGNLLQHCAVCKPSYEYLVYMVLDVGVATCLGRLDTVVKYLDSNT